MTLTWSCAVQVTVGMATALAGHVSLALLQVTVYYSPVEAEGSIWPTSVLNCHRERWIY